MSFFAPNISTDALIGPVSTGAVDSSVLSFMGCDIASKAYSTLPSTALPFLFVRSCHPNATNKRAVHQC